jgi:hypothetical protein
VTGSILQEVLHFQMAFNEGEPDFRDCAGWLDHWKGRYEVRLLRICGEKLLLAQLDLYDSHAFFQYYALYFAFTFSLGYQFGL